LDGQLSLWDKLEPQRASSSEKVNDENAGGAKRPEWVLKLLWIGIDLVASAWWLYVLLRVFVGDFDRWVVQAVAPSLAWMLDYRLFGVLLAAALCLIFVKRKYFWFALYVLFFPLVVFLWKLPRFLYRRRSWTLLLGTVHVLVATIRGFKFTLVSVTTAAFAFLIIVASTNHVLLSGASVALLALWFASLYKAFRYSLAPARFVRQQQRLLERVLLSDRAWTWFEVDKSVRDPALVKMNDTQQQQFLLKVGTGLIAHRGSHFWAYRLDHYRKSGASIVFSAVSIIGLLLQAIITFMFVNEAVYKISADQFHVENAASYMLFAYYSFASLFVSEISAITPVGSWAAAIQIVAGFSAAVVVFILIATIFFGIRQSRTDESANEAISQMRVKGDEFALRLSGEYELSMDAISRHLTDFGWDFLGILAYLTREAPPTTSGDTRQP
jgi:hypothetical protein